MKNRDLIAALKKFPDDMDVIISPPNSLIGYPVLSLQGTTFVMATTEKQCILLNGALQRAYLQ